MAPKDSPRSTAEKIVVAAFKLLLPGTATRIEGVADIADVLTSRQGNRRARQTLQHRLDESVDLLSERLEHFEAVEFRELKTGEKTQVIEGISRAMAEINVSPVTVIKDQLDPEHLASQVRPHALRYWRSSYVSDAATEYGERYLAIACTYIVSLVRQLPEFSEELLLQNYATTEKIYELLQRAISTVIQPTSKSAIAGFEAAYLTDVVQTFKDMELFGLTGIPPELCRQPLDIAYIALQSSIRSKSVRARRREHDNDGGLLHPQPDDPKRVHEAFDAILRANMVEDNAGVSRPNPIMGTRTLLTGPAGSGKTTVAHWLALRSAQHNFPNRLRYWNDCFPFIAALRHIFATTRGYSPRDEDLIRTAFSGLDQVPPGWLQSKLSTRALIILDGLDELSDLHKSNARVWIEKILLAYPLAHVIVTSRPEGLDLEWFSARGFTNLELQPMNPGEVRLCVDSWFEAVMTADARRTGILEKVQKRLVTDLEQRRAVRELAETPLLCAMLCAFYSFSLSAIAPQTRVELYERVVNTLVHTREVARSAERTSSSSVPLRVKLDLLQALARHLVEQSQTTILCSRPGGEPTDQTEATARDVISERLAGMTPVSASADELLSLLIERSVVFRRVAQNEAQFVHRSLQEYLAACDYAENGLMDELVARAGLPDWQPIIAFCGWQDG